MGVVTAYAFDGRYLLAFIAFCVLAVLGYWEITDGRGNDGDD